MISQIVLSACISWCSAVLLSFLFAVIVDGRMSLDTLRLPGVVPVAVLASTVIAVLMTPVVFWSFKSWEKDLIFYGAGLIVLLSVYIVFVTPASGQLGLYGSLALAIVGLVIIGMIHR